MRKIKLGAIAVALALTTALPVDVPYTAGLIGTPVAQAGLLKNIKLGVKSVGRKAKGAAIAVGSNVKEAAGVAKQTIKHDAPYVGRAIKKGAKAVGRGYLAFGKAVNDALGVKFEPPGLPPNLNKPLPKPPNGGPGSWGGNTGKSALARTHRR
ncbi:MAG: hypothetical protein R3D62_12795 [Xanthobacteraceae bacterium]